LDKLTIPSRHDLPLRLGDFPTLSDALDYAAEGETGLSFYDARSRLTQTLSYHDLSRRARALARRLLALGLSRGDRVAAIAETHPEFVVTFFACQYAGLVPVPLPISLNLGGRDAYVVRLRGLLRDARVAMVTAPQDFLPVVEEACKDLSGLRVFASDSLEALPEGDVTLVPSRPDELAYLQFTSGSTSFPRGVEITQNAAMSNLRGIVRTGLEIRRGDRAASWLPFYHDMGLVGFLLGPMVSQVSADYIRTRDFAVRPLSWLRLISQNRATIAFGPSIAFHLCRKRLRPRTLEELDLSSWRIAGVGAEMIRPGALDDFATAFEPAGFDRRAFLPCFGLAEATLAVTFSPVGGGMACDPVDTDVLADTGVAQLAGPNTRSVTEIVNCGRVLPDHEVRICDENGEQVDVRVTGRVLLRGPSVMRGYFENAEETAATLSDDGWLDTGDLGYLTEDGLFITGRVKDLIIINGRNIWPQDLEHIAEQQPAVRIGDASAFAVSRSEGGETAVLVVQCRLSDEGERALLMSAVRSAVYEHFGLQCVVELVPPGTLPRTSSGKLARGEAKQDFLRRSKWGELEATVGGANA
jgi:fatty-acyl-CoA synthase